MLDNSSAKPLDLSKPVQTRNGCKVRVLAVNAKMGRFPVVGLIHNSDGTESISTWTTEGFSFGPSAPRHSDLVNVPEYVYVLMTRRPAEHTEGHHLYYHTYSDRKRAEADQEFLRQKGYTLFNITELTIHI